MAAVDLTGTFLQGRYRITRTLGAGGMGQVYEGVDETLECKVAIKVLLRKHADDDRFRSRFLREARAASKVRHPNVVQITDFGEHPNGSVYLVMEFLDGHDLQQLLRREKSLPWPRVRHILRQIVSAIGATHDCNIVHRDIKPANFFLVKARGLRDFVKLLDFGIAKLATDPAGGDKGTALTLTGTGEVFGTAKYMAPEVAYGTTDDPRIDIYAVGVVAYEMLTGRVPFDGGSVFEILKKHVDEPPRPLREIDPRIPAEVEAMVLRALAKKPEQRFGSMDELEAAISAIPERVGRAREGVGVRLGGRARDEWGGRAGRDRRAERDRRAGRDGRARPAEPDGGAELGGGAEVEVGTETETETEERLPQNRQAEQVQAEELHLDVPLPRSAVETAPAEAAEVADAVEIEKTAISVAVSPRRAGTPAGGMAPAAQRPTLSVPPTVPAREGGFFEVDLIEAAAGGSTVVAPIPSTTTPVAVGAVGSYERAGGSAGVPAYEAGGRGSGVVAGSLTTTPSTEIDGGDATDPAAVVGGAGSSTSSIGRGAMVSQTGSESLTGFAERKRGFGVGAALLGLGAMLLVGGLATGGTLWVLSNADETAEAQDGMAVVEPRSAGQEGAAAVEPESGRHEGVEEKPGSAGQEGAVVVEPEASLVAEEEDDRGVEGIESTMREQAGDGVPPAAYGSGAGLLDADVEPDLIIDDSAAEEEAESRGASPPTPESPSVEPEAPEGPTAAECSALRAEAFAAKAVPDWNAVLSRTKQRECWSGSKHRNERRGLRVAAYAELGNYERCVKEGGRSSKPEIHARVQYCTKKLGTKKG